mgnify:CR=1 FL=1
MADFQQTIAKLFPEATFEQADTLVVNIADAQWHSLAKELKENPALGFDYLIMPTMR